MEVPGVRDAQVGGGVGRRGGRVLHVLGLAGGRGRDGRARRPGPGAVLGAHLEPVGGAAGKALGGVAGAAAGGARPVPPRAGVGSDAVAVAGRVRHRVPRERQVEVPGVRDAQVGGRSGRCPFHILLVSLVSGSGRRRRRDSGAYWAFPAAVHGPNLEPVGGPVGQILRGVARARAGDRSPLPPCRGVRLHPVAVAGGVGNRVPLERQLAVSDDGAKVCGGSGWRTSPQRPNRDQPAPKQDDRPQGAEPTPLCACANGYPFPTAHSNSRPHPPLFHVLDEHDASTKTALGVVLGETPRDA